jgi:DNA-binding NtrC family response regulator
MFKKRSSQDQLEERIKQFEKEGIETVMEIKRQFPNAKVIVVSGGGWYGTDLDFDMAEKLGALTLKKPFELQELSAAIQKLLN